MWNSPLQNVIKFKTPYPPNKTPMPLQRKMITSTLNKQENRFSTPALTPSKKASLNKAINNTFTTSSASFLK